MLGWKQIQLRTKQCREVVFSWEEPGGQNGVPRLTGHCSGCCVSFLRGWRTRPPRPSATGGAGSPRVGALQLGPKSAVIYQFSTKLQHRPRGTTPCKDPSLPPSRVPKLSANPHLTGLPEKLERSNRGFLTSPGSWSVPTSAVLAVPEFLERSKIDASVMLFGNSSAFQLKPKTLCASLLRAISTQICAPSTSLLPTTLSFLTTN